MMELYIGILNSCVHICMYSYYFLSSFKQLNQHLQVIKPLITSLQIVQLFILMIHCLIGAWPSCGATNLLWLPFASISFLIYQFVMFYIKTYSLKKA